MCVQTVSLTEPVVPFIHETKATEGRLYTIVGMVPPHARRFSVNFCIGGENGETALHLDSRLDKKTIVRNSWLEKAWGPEEKQGGNFPLSQGQPFELMILVDKSCFFIAYNGTHYTEFEHRRPPSKIDTIAINGDVVLSCYSEDQTGNSLPKVCPQSPGRRIKEISHEMGKHVYNLPGGLSEKSTLRIIGITNGSFFLNFVNSLSTKEDVGLHLNYRHRINKVVLNSLCKGKWEEELRPSQLSFHLGHHFDLALSATKKELRLKLGDNPAAFFPLRHTSASDLKHLVVDGDVHMVWLSQEDI